MAAEIKIRAERRAGELLADMDKAKGGRPEKTGETMEPVNDDAPRGVVAMPFDQEFGASHP